MQSQRPHYTRLTRHNDDDGQRRRDVETIDDQSFGRRDQDHDGGYFGLFTGTLLVG